MNEKIFENIESEFFFGKSWLMSHQKSTNFKSPEEYEKILSTPMLMFFNTKRTHNMRNKINGVELLCVCYLFVSY